MQYARKPIIENSPKIEIGSVVRKALLDIALRNNIATPTLTTKEAVINFLLTLESKLKLKYYDIAQASNRTFVNQQFTYTKSNLNKGFIIWFKCKLCDRRAKYLYCPDNSNELLCRKCHRLAYKSQNVNKYIYSKLNYE